MLNLQCPTDLQCLASGDCSIAEENDALMQCEASPSLYRSVALALIEHRQLAASLREFSEGSLSPVSLRAVEHEGWAKWKRTGLRIAASLLLVVTCGTFAFQLGRGQAPEAIVADENLSHPIVVHVQYPKSDDARLASSSAPTSMVLPMLTSEAVQILREAGFDADERVDLQWRHEADGTQRAVSDRYVNVRYAQP